MLKDDPTPPFDLLLKDHDPAAGVNACRMLAKLKNTAWASLPVVGAPAGRHSDAVPIPGAARRSARLPAQQCQPAKYSDVVPWMRSLQRP